MTEIKVNFSFLKMFNTIKGIYKPHKEDDYDENWLEERANPKEKQLWNDYINHYDKIGVKHPKVKYPVMFGKGDYQYPGTLATGDIKKGEIIIEVPGSEIINTKKAFYSDLNPIFYNHPDIFGKHLTDGEDMMVYSFMLHEIQKGEKSRYY